MRFQLTLRKTSRQSLLPINYQYELSSWIYKVIQQADAGFSQFLHQQGYARGHKKFKLFTFSPLSIYPFKLHQETQRLEILGEQVSLIISFLIDRAAEHFIKGVFLDQQFGIGDTQSQVDFEVAQVESLPPPVFQETMSYRALSPICISAKWEGNRHAQYLAPDQPDYQNYFIQHLLEKSQASLVAATNPDRVPNPVGVEEVRFRLLSPAKSRLVKLKAFTPEETKVRGWLYEFELTAPMELQELGYYAGFGEKNSMGFGCAEVGNKRP